MKTHTFKRLLRYLKGHRLRLFFVLLFASVSTIFHRDGPVCDRQGHNDPV